MKKIILIIGIAGLALNACKKNSPEPQTPDSDVTYAKDAVQSYETMNDVFLMAALTRDTYTSTPFFGSTGVTIKKDTVAKVDTLIFSNANGTDGNTRNGVILINYSASTLNAKYIRQPGFKATVTLQNYVINTTTVSSNPIIITNTTPNGFNPNTTKLSWSAAYTNFTINDGTRSVVINNATHSIALNNTNDPNVYNSTGNIPIQWQNANINLTGNAVALNNKGAFNVTFNNPSTDFLYRDFKNCAPEALLKPGKHPFIKGLIYVKPIKPAKNTQFVNLGEGTCDYNIKVTIDGISYQTDVL
ncbi:MAG TPA: hypothetical protein PK995_08135 [Bacteroidia bacterium]|nr:hypothetical protein [Bacteroidia bacterium]